MENSKEFTPKGEAEIRELVIKEYDLADSDENKSFIEKAVKKELDFQTHLAEVSNKEKAWELERIEHEKKLSKAIEQKAKWRDEAKKALELDEPEPKAEPKPTGEPAPAKPQENEDIALLKKELAEIRSSNHRQKYSHLKDDEYSTVLTIAGGIEKFDDTLNSNPIVKTYLETNKINERVSSATNSPSTKTSPSATMGYDEVNLENPEHIKWLKADPKRISEYESWMEKEGSKNLSA